MAFQLPNLPNFQTNIPQADPLQTYGKLLQLKALQGQQALLPLEVQQKQQAVQAETLQNQKTQQDLDSRQALMKMVASGELNKYAGVQTPDGSGFDAAGAYQHMLQNGVLPDQAGEYANSWLKIGQTQAETRKTLGQAGEAEQNIRDKTLKQVASKLGSIGDMKLDDATKALASFKQDLVKNPKAYAGLTQIEMGELFGADLTHMDALEGHLGMGAMIADYHKAQSEGAAAEQKVVQPGQKMSVAQQAEANKEVQVAQREQPLKIQTAEIEAKAKQLMEGLAEPGYAFNPKTGQTQLVNKTEYLQSGGQLQAFRKVGEKDVRDDTMLLNRLGDVHQKIAEYEKALQQPISSQDQGNIAGLLGTTGLKVGAFGTEIPMNRVNAALNKENLEKLSGPARDVLVAYRNAREAMLGYKTVLSGSARGSDKSLDLLTQALPDPSITDPDFSKRSLDAFKGNLHIVGQGLPTLPGIKNPQQIEQEVWGDKGMSQSAKPAGTIPGPGNAQLHYQGKKGEIFSNDGQTWYDAKGNLVSGSSNQRAK